MLDPKEERQYERLRKLGQKLHIPIPEAFLTLEVFDKDGKLIQRHHQRSHSWVRNAYHLMFQELAHAPHDQAKSLHFVDTSGVTQSQSSFIAAIADGWAEGKGYWAGAAGDLFGIVVGSGTNAESFEDYALQTQIATGTGSGELSYIASETPVISTEDTTIKQAQLVRYFNNNSGGDIDVNEVALYDLMKNLGGSVYFLAYIMTSRDKLASTVTVPDTGQLKVTYTIQLTYPA